MTDADDLDGEFLSRHKQDSVVAYAQAELTARWLQLLNLARSGGEAGETSAAKESALTASCTKPSTTAQALREPAEYQLLAFLASIFIFRGFLPAWGSLNSDLRNYYITARLYRESSSVNRVYDFEWFQRQKDHRVLSNARWDLSLTRCCRRCRSFPLPLSHPLQPSVVGRL